MIKTTIAKILSPTRFVLAAGAQQGLREGMEFIIYELSDPIYDPETKEPLGQLELHKGRVKVIHVQDQLATATTMIRRAYQPSMHELLGAFMPRTEGKWVETHEQLPIETSQATLVKSDLTVRVGDPVRSVN